MEFLGADGGSIHFSVRGSTTSESEPWSTSSTAINMTSTARLIINSSRSSRRGGVALHHVATPVSRYFTNSNPQMNPHDAEGWNFVDYLRWMYQLGARGTRACSCPTPI